MNMVVLNGIFLIAFFLLVLLAPLQAVAEEANSQGEKAYIVNDYRYDPAGSGGDPDIGLSLCSTRCNALSFDYADYVMADPREVQRVASDREITLPLNNPFMKGNCICTVDEYVIKPNIRNRPK